MLRDVPTTPRSSRVNRSRPGGEPQTGDRPNVLLIGSEALPYAKTGGLADVLGALPPAIARLGWAVTIALPKYRAVNAGTLVEHFPITIGGFTGDVGFFDAPLAGAARALLI